MTLRSAVITSVALAAGCGGADDPSDTSPDAVPCPSEGAWLDTTTGLCWENPSSDELFSPEEADAHCDGPVIGDLDDWRMPGVNDLRSLIRGCPTTETGGSCEATDECPSACATDTASTAPPRPGQPPAATGMRRCPVPASAGSSPRDPTGRSSSRWWLDTRLG